MAAVGRGGRPGRRPNGGTARVLLTSMVTECDTDPSDLEIAQRGQPGLRGDQLSTVERNS